MLINFFMTVRRYQVPVTIRELIDLTEALKKGIIYGQIDDFYLVSRACLVKDEKHYDKFDRAFSVYFKGLDDLQGILKTLIPDEWLRREFMNSLSREDLERLNSMGGLEKLVDAFREIGENSNIRENNNDKHARNEINGNGDVAPGKKNVKKRKDKRTWKYRRYRNFDDSVELGTRNIKLALRRLRKLARSGKHDEFDIENTIHKTAHNGGLLDIQMRPERRNIIKVLLFFDIGGSMDAYIRVCEELFSASKTEFKFMEIFYFHNFIYDSVWKDNKRKTNERIPTIRILQKFLSDCRIIFVGDATMAPYEITHVGGSIEHWNEEPGTVWMQRFCMTYNKIIWINPVPRDNWAYSGSVGIVKKLVDDRMFPLTLSGIEQGMNYLSK